MANFAQKSAFFFVACLLLGSTAAHSQVPQELERPRLTLGATGGMFRISHDQFDNSFKSKWGPSWGAHAIVRLSNRYHVVAKYKRYAKSEDITIDQESLEIDWQQQWINLGLRFSGSSAERITSSLGFGLAFFNATGNSVDQVLRGNPLMPQYVESEKSATGFFLDLGVNIPLHKLVSLLVELELSSASPEGGGGFEATSIGGIFFGVGVNIIPF